MRRMWPGWPTWRVSGGSAVEPAPLAHPVTVPVIEAGPAPVASSQQRLVDVVVDPADGTFSLDGRPASAGW